MGLTFDQDQINIQTAPVDLNADDRLKLILDNAGVGIVVLDKSNTHVIVNPTFCGITGFEKMELIGSSVPAPYWSNEHIDQITDILKKLRQSSYIRTESYFQRKDGGVFPVKIIGSIIQDEKFNNEAILIIENISKFKRTQHELKMTQMMLIAMNKDLEQKVQDRTEQIQRLLKQKDEFIDQLGHDLKNPLTPITRLLPKISDQITDKKTKERLEILERNVQHMKNLVINTLFLAKLNSSKITMTFERINVLEECNNCVLKNKLQFQEKNITTEVSIAEDIFIKADKIHFIEIIDNILSNSCKYSPENSHISVTARMQDNTCIISIKDNGIGMSKEQIDHMFDEFYKADPSRHDFESTGLGMAICKRIIDKHQGKIWVESEGHMKGTTTHICIPLWDEEENLEKKKEFKLTLKDLQKQEKKQ